MFQTDQSSGGQRWPLVRVQIGGETQVVLLSMTMLPLTVHWVSRSVPCGGDGCSLCSWLPGRGLYYLPVMCQGRASILELGSMSASHLEQHCKLLHGGIATGHVLRLSRRTAKAPIYAEVLETKTGVRNVPMVDFAGRVMALYQLPGPNPGESIDDYSVRCSKICLRRSESELARLKARSEKSVSSR